MTVSNSNKSARPSTSATEVQGQSPRTAGGRSRRAGAKKRPAGRMTFVVYTDNSWRWRWRLVTNRGQVLAESGQHYGRQQEALDAVGKVQGSAAGAGLAAH
jgi:uncharacterized protein YegP (UPF0339 family)